MKNSLKGLGLQSDLTDHLDIISACSTMKEGIEEYFNGVLVEINPDFGETNHHTSLQGYPDKEDIDKFKASAKKVTEKLKKLDI